MKRWRKSKLGRNDRCPCDSGLKYKRCCLPKEKHKHRKLMADLARPFIKDEKYQRLLVGMGYVRRKRVQTHKVRGNV